MGFKFISGFSMNFYSVVTASKLYSSSPSTYPDVLFVRFSLNFLIYSVLFHSLWYHVKTLLWNSDISLLEKGWRNEILSSIWILFITGNQRYLVPTVIMIIIQCLSIYNISIIYNLSALIILYVHRLKYLTKVLWRVQYLDF